MLVGEDKIKIESMVLTDIGETQSEHQQLLAGTMEIKISWSL